MSWVFENLCNWGEGGSCKFERVNRIYAEDMAHEQLRGRYHSVRYWVADGYLQTTQIKGSETHYFNSRGLLVGKVYHQE